ncbi:MAG: cysteine desulfurase [Clostridiaceae bacterium]|mgnify:CR=1 FL=1|nr:cysteine desulfurase [Clostridiaceae bacterium]
MYREIYLDNSATTRPYDEVIDYMGYIQKEVYGNPSSLHTKGVEAEKLVKNAREIISKTLEVERDEIYFTSGGTEANNLAVRGYLESNPRKGKHIITTQIEHPSVLEVYKHLEQNGYKVDYLGVDSNGEVDLSSLKSSVNKETSLISIIHTNNETGAVQPLDEIVRIVKGINRETAVHVDGVQAYGKVRVLPRKLGVDIFTFSSHKIHGPKGVGAVYLNKGIRLKTQILGGGQERMLRSGTENVAGICGFGMAADIAYKNIQNNNALCLNLKGAFIEKLKGCIEDFTIITPEKSSPFILNISFGGIRAEVLLHHLEMRNIFVSTGSACSSRKNVHSHVLKAAGYKPQVIDGAIRFSFSAFNRIEDVEDTVDAIRDILPKISIKRGGKK